MFQKASLNEAFLMKMTTGDGRETIAGGSIYDRISFYSALSEHCFTRSTKMRGDLDLYIHSPYVFMA
jgi:hypothetical protein